MAEKEESEADVQFVEEGVLVLEAERTLSSRFSNINLTTICAQKPRLLFIYPFPTQLKSRRN